MPYPRRMEVSGARLVRLFNHALRIVAIGRLSRLRAQGILRRDIESITSNLSFSASICDFHFTAKTTALIAEFQWEFDIKIH